MLFIGDSEKLLKSGNNNIQYGSGSNSVLTLPEQQTTPAPHSPENDPVRNKGMVYSSNANVSFS